ncbi:MAG: hypothetical protein IPL46_17805 [Saprospiraceae bacterium]|nr:hypothetical protein [Saprospiraceae bacterium]
MKKQLFPQKSVVKLTSKTSGPVWQWLKIAASITLIAFISYWLFNPADHRGTSGNSSD